MEAQAKMLADLIATVSSMNAKLDDLHPVVLELNQCRPGVERAADALRAEVGDLRARVVDTTHPAEPAAGTDMPPPFLLSADAPSSSSKSASASKQTSAAAATSGIDVCTRASPLDTNGCVAEVPAQACSSPDQDALSTSMGVTTVELLREQPPELASRARPQPPRCARSTVVHDICRIPDAATPLCVWGVYAPSRGAPPAPGRRLVASLELDKRTPTRCLVLGASAAFNDKSMAVDAPVNDTDEHLSLLTPLSGCDSSKSRPAPWPSFGDLPGGMHLPEPRPQLQKSEEGILSGLINRDNQVTVQHIDDSVSCGVHRSSFALFQWEIAGQLGGRANYASNNRTLDGKEVLLTWSHFLRIQILALPSKEISFETDPMSLQRYTSFSIGNCFGGEWFNGILLQAYLLSQFIGCVTSCGFELLQWQIAWSHHLQCSEITSAEIKEHLLPDMCEKIIPATFMFVCYWAVGWSVLSTIVRSTEESILIDSMKRNKSTRSCQTLILAFLEVTTKITVDSELLYYYQAYTFRTAAALELQQSMYKLFSEGTCQACKVKSYRKFFDPIIVNLGHLSSPVIQHAIHGSSHCHGVDFCSSFPRCTHMWRGQSKENGELIQWLPKNQQWKIPWKMSSNHSPLPSSNSFTTHVPSRVTCETMSIVQLSSEPLGHPLDVIRIVKWHGTSLIEKNLVLSQYKAHKREGYSMIRVAPLESGLSTRELMLGRGRLVGSPEHGLFLPWYVQLHHPASWFRVDYAANIPEMTGRGKQAGPAASTQQAGQPAVLCLPLLDHYWRAGQYRDSMNSLGHKWTPEGKHWYAPWDPGGGILQVFADCGLRASRMLRRGECHGPCGLLRLGRMGGCKKGDTGPRPDGKPN